ncbi:UNVERIFIED_CONTAM: hypothetical protein FKN15_025664 [Acipenser sinensis]
MGGNKVWKCNKPPGLVPNKPLYMTKNLQKLASYCKVLIQGPSNPFEAMFEKEAELCWGPRGGCHIGSDAPVMGDGKPAGIASPHSATANLTGQTQSTFSVDKRQGWSLFSGIGSQSTSALD